MKNLITFAILSCLPIMTLAEDIEDNSFLIEEAYNQEKGVVQFINSYQYLQRSKDWAYTFVNEFPVGSQNHQFSYSLPYNHIDDSNSSGVGDLLLNYRYQLVSNEHVAMAPRISLVVPTGKSNEGLGSGALGLQFNHAISVKISPKFVNHLNAGFTWIPNAKEPGGSTATTLSFNYGTSLIYLFSENLNFLTELVGTSTELPQADGTTVREETFFVVPGFRYAINLEPDWQIVPGLGFPFGLGPSERENGVFGYLSFEGKLW